MLLFFAHTILDFWKYYSAKLERFCYFCSNSNEGDQVTNVGETTYLLVLGRLEEGNEMQIGLGRLPA